MRVNLHIIQEDLDDLNLQGHLSDEPWTMRCSHAIACTKLLREFTDDAIYIVKPGLLPRHFSDEYGTPSIISIGRPADEWIMAPCNVLYIEDEIELVELFNRVSASIAGYQEWEDDLLAILEKRTWADELPACVFRYIRNPFFLQGSAFNMLVTAIPEGAVETPLLTNYRSEYSLGDAGVLVPEDISQLIADDEYNEAIESEEPTIYSGKNYGFRTLYYNIRIDGVPVARFGIDEVIAPFTSRDFALAKVIGRHLAKALGQKQAYVFDRSEEMDPILGSLLSHTLLPEERIVLLLNSLGWDMHDDYACLSLKLRTTMGSESVLDSLALGISKMLDDECYTVFGDSVVFVCNLTKMGTDGDQMLSEVLPYLRDNLFMASLSSTYDDFKELYYYYRQAEAAFDIGLRKDPTRWTFRFEDYQMDYLIGKVLEKNVPGVLIPKGLKRLQAHDEEKGSGYVELLRVYLDNDRSIADTIRIVHIHRNTFLYRIQKIEEILDMDLDDPDVRIVLQVALRVMETTGSGTRAAPLEA